MLDKFQFSVEPAGLQWTAVQLPSLTKVITCCVL